MIEEGTFTLPTRIYLSPEHRVRLQRLVVEQGVDLPELLTTLLIHHLDALPADEPEPPSPVDIHAKLAQRRAELQRVRARQRGSGKDAPSWLVGYIAELEAEIRVMSNE